jgi:hypothetical protein
LKILKRKAKTKNLFLLLRLFQKFVRKTVFLGSGILKMNLTHTQFSIFLIFLKSDFLSENNEYFFIFNLILDIFRHFNLSRKNLCLSEKNTKGIFI